MTALRSGYQVLLRPTGTACLWAPKDTQESTLTSPLYTSGSSIIFLILTAKLTLTETENDNWKHSERDRKVGGSEGGAMYVWLLPRSLEHSW